jgi:DNA-binding MarR family transcriptional regulator
MNIQPDEVRELLVQFVGDIMSSSIDDVMQLLRREEISIPLISVMNLAHRHQNCTISDVSAKLEVSMAHASMMVDKLVCRGLMTRIEAPHDRRQKLIALTDEGKHLLREFHRTRVDGMVQHFMQLPPELLASAIEALRQVSQSKASPVSSDPRS